MSLSRRNAIFGAGVASGLAMAGAGVSRASPRPPSSATVDVKNFGAIGDGIADDTESIQNAIDSVVHSGGGQVFLPAGLYRLTYKISLGSGVHVAGVGSASVLRPEYSEKPPNRVIDNDWQNGNANISLRNFKLDRSGANVQHGILLNGVDNLLIDGVEISGTPAATSGCISVSGVGPWNRLISRNIRIVNCLLSDTSNFGVQLGYVDSGIVANNNAFRADREVFGVEPDPGVSATNVVISGNTISGTAKIDGTATGLIIITTSSGGSVSGVTVQGNVMRQPSVSDTQNPGINVLGATAVNIVGNTIYEMDGPGISIGNLAVATTGVLISGNMIYNCGRSGALSGVRLRNAHRCSLAGNYIYSDDGIPSVSEEGGSSENHIGINSPIGRPPSPGLQPPLGAPSP